MTKNNIKIGIIGCGNIAHQKHLPSLKKLGEQVSLIGFCDELEERALEAGNEYGNSGFKVYTDYRELLINESIDVVHVLTPNISHAEISIAALEAGKHVMCEKPMAINSKEAKKMVDAAERTGKKLTIGYQHRFRKDSQFLKEAIKNNELGDIYHAKSHAVRRRGVPTWGVFLDKNKQGGGALIDIGTHALDLTLWLMDNYEPELVDGAVHRKLTEKSDGNMFGKWDTGKFSSDLEDSAFGYIKMKNGATIFLEAAWALNVIDPKESQVTLCGTEAGAEMFGNPDDNEGYVVLNTSKYNRLIDSNTKTDNLIESLKWKEDLGYLEAKNWINAIENNTDPMVLPQQAYNVTRILEAIYLSAETRNSVQI